MYHGRELGSLGQSVLGDAINRIQQVFAPEKNHLEEMPSRNSSEEGALSPFTT